MMYKDILEKLSYPISFVSEEYTYIYVNEKYGSLFGKDVNQIIGNKLTDFLDKKVFEKEIKPNIDRALSGEELTYEVKVKLNKKLHYMRMHYTPFYDEQNNIKGIISHGEDITLEPKNKKQLKYNKEYLETVFKVNPNILLLSNGRKLFKANDAFFDFLPYKNLKEFKKEYDCICDLFLEEKGFLKKKIGKQYWVDYILDNPKKTHKAILKNKQGGINYFKVNAKKLNLDTKQRTVVSLTDITTQVNENENVLKILKNLPIASFVLDKNHKVKFWNKACVNLTGKPFEKLKSTRKHWTGFYFEKRPLLADLILEKNSIEEIRKHYKDSVVSYDEHFDIVSIEAFIPKLGKSGKWLSFYAVPIKNSEDEVEFVVEMLLDITKEKVLKEKLLDNRKVLTNILDETLSGYWDWDLKNNTEYLSPGFKSMFGYKDEEIENSHSSLKKLIFDEDLEKEEKSFRNHILSKGKVPYFCEIRCSHKNGSTIWIARVGRVISWDENKAPLRMVGCHIDITNRVKLEEQLKKQEEIMIAQSRHAAMGEMISMIAHQWRQPLSVISMGANNILADIDLDTLDTVVLKALSKDILYQTDELSKTIDDFKNFFRPQKEKEEISVESILDEALLVVGKSLENHNIELVKQVETQKEIVTYSRELMQVIINIIKNAKEALVLNKDTNRVLTIQIKEKDDKINIKIKDNGGGVDPKIIKNIFDPYFTTKGEHNGTGLGLYMSKTIVESHLKGKIDCQNDKDGAVFNLTISSLKD